MSAGTESHSTKGSPVGDFKVPDTEETKEFYEGTPGRIVPPTNEEIAALYRAQRQVGRAREVSLAVLKLPVKAEAKEAARQIRDALFEGEVCDCKDPDKMGHKSSCRWHWEIQP